ncbi:MAG: hypothetical protein IT300_14295 [Dehalococcoidia bacterium]|nr:hypothetical protein [Dehalococcoidia bacterium]
MRIRRLALVAVFAFSLLSLVGMESPAPALAQTVPYNVASESYYRLNTAAGRITVSVHAEYQNAIGKDLPTLPVYLMPGAENVVVKAGDEVLETKVTPGNEAAGLAGAAVATLPRPLKTNTRIVLDATYDVAPRTGGKIMTLEAGLIETAFIGQGPGSFVLVDVPKAGDNYFDPGCLLASSQPGDVKADGFERWVCGEVTVIGLNADDPDVIRRCAAMDDKCRQRTDIRVFSAYVQSVTDFSKSAKLEGDVVMPDGRTVHLALKYFKRDQAWADKQWAIAQKAFPMLETVFGWPYPNKTLVMRQSHHIERAGAAGVAFPTIGEVLLATDTGFDEEVTIHELAHSWAGFNLETKWLWEGLAEYGTKAIASDLGVRPVETGWSTRPYKNEPLSMWYHGSDIYDSEFWYGKAGAFWFAYETAIGGRANMTALLGRMDDEQSLLPLDAGWFMDQGEWVSGNNLDSLFVEWVYNPVTSKSLLADRRAAHDLVKALQARGTSLGLSGMPSDIYDNLLAWVFDPVAGQVAKANKVLDSYAEVLALSTEAGLGTPDGVSQSWGKKRVADTAIVVEEQRQAILAILSATKDLESAADDSVARQKLAEAREKYSAGDYAGAKAAAAGGLTAAYNEVAAGKMIAIAREKQQSFSPNFFGRIGMFFTNPAGDLAKAEAAYAAGDGTKALELSRGAYDSWDGATQRGIQRLAMGAGIMCMLTFLVWFVLRRLSEPTVVTRKAGQGHHLEEAGERRSSWRDWENTP